MSRLTLESLTKTFAGGVAAVDRLDLDVADGELLALVGPSGCGKTTTLRLIAGLEQATAGSVRIADRPVDRLPPAKRDVAMVFQEPALYPHLSVRRNLEFGLRLRRLPQAEIAGRVQAAAAAMAIGGLLDRLPRALSGGERQRAALGRAVARQPQLFLFDEPLSQLDEPLRLELRAEIARLQRALGATMLYVTHDQQEALTLGQRVAVMQAGQLRQLGTPQEVFERPADRFVAEFIGAPAMNFFDGRLMRDERGWRFESAAVSVPLPGGERYSRLDRLANETPAVLGARPEAIRPIDLPQDHGPQDHGPQDRASAGPASFPATVTAVQWLGERSLIWLAHPAVPRIVAALASPAAPASGARGWFALDPARVHLFAPGPRGVNLLAAPPTK